MSLDGGAPSGPVVQTTDVGHTYRSGTEALRSVTLAWSSGVVALLGPNGAGKTTLLKAVVGALRPTSGRVALVGADESEARVGYLPQDAGWLGSFRVVEFAHYFAWLQGVPKRQRVDSAVEALQRVQAADLADRRLSELSGGQHRRVMLSQALVHAPDILVLDEPTAGLDPEQRIHFRSLIADLARSRVVILSTHMVEDVATTADWVSVLKDGAITFDGTMDRFLQSAPAVPGATPENRLERAYLQAVL